MAGLLCFAFTADYLVVKFDVDIRILVPAHLRESVAVEFLKARHFVVEEFCYCFLSLLAVDIFWQFTEEYYMVAYSRYYLHILVGQDVDLFYQIFHRSFCIMVLPNGDRYVVAYRLLMLPVAMMRSLV